MKKFFILAALGGMMLTGCVKNEDLSVKDPKAISFEVATYKSATRADVNPTELAEGQFGVNAYHKNNSTTQIMIDEVVKYKDGTPAATWQTDKDYYWPIVGTVDFIAYYPTSIKPTVDNVGTDDQNQLSYNVTLANTEAEHDNIMYADKAFMYNANEAYNGFTGVPTLFRHALAKLNFNVYNSYGTDGVKGNNKFIVKVEKIVLEGVYNKGTLTLTNTGRTDKGLQEWTKPTGNVWTIDSTSTATADYLTWTNPNASVAISTSKDAPTEVNADLVRYVMPQTLANADNEQTITIYCKISQQTKVGDAWKDVVTDEDKEYTVKLYSENLQSWQMNQNITYTIAIGPDDNIILFAPNVEEWAPVSGTVVVG